MIDLHSLVQKQIFNLKRHIGEIKHERDTAATPIESRSDQTRQVADQLLQALEDKLSQLYLIQKQLHQPSSFNQTVQLNTLVSLKTTGNDQLQFLISPPGLGGNKIKGFTLLSSSAPLAKQIMGKRTGFCFNFNSTDYSISDIRPNQ